MATPKKYAWLDDSKRTRKRRQNIFKETARGRSLNLERLEARHLLAGGPSLVAVRPNTGGFLDENSVLNEAPRELVLQFSPGQVIDPATLASGIQLTRAGLDAEFSPASVASDFNTDGAVVLGFEAGRLGPTGSVSLAITPGARSRISMRKSQATPGRLQR